AVPLDGVRRVDGHLVVGGIPVLDGQVVVIELDIQVGQDQLVLDEVPDDPGHLVAVYLDDGIHYLDLGHATTSLHRPSAVARGDQGCAGSSPATSRPVPSAARTATSVSRRLDASMPTRRSGSASLVRAVANRTPATANVPPLTFCPFCRIQASASARPQIATA